MDEPETLETAEMADATSELAEAQAEVLKGFERPQRSATSYTAAIAEEYLPLVRALGDAPDVEAASRKPSAIARRIGGQNLKGGGNVAVIDLTGPITPHGSMLARLLGMGPGGLDGFRAGFREALADDSVSAIVFNIDSPGGLIDLVPETAAEIRGARGQKPIIAVANTMAASAAYWIAAQADEIVVTPSGQVGSVGVYTVHEDVSRMEAAMGIQTTIISAGRYKVEGNPYEPLSKGALAAMQQQVDDIYGMFVSDVAAGRNLDVRAVTAGYGQGRSLLADRAKAVGMVDRVETFEETIARLAGTPVEMPDDDGESLAPGQDGDTPSDAGPVASETSDSPEASEAPETAVGIDYLSIAANVPDWVLGDKPAAVDYLSGEANRPSWRL